MTQKYRTAVVKFTSSCTHKAKRGGCWFLLWLFWRSLFCSSLPQVLSFPRWPL